MRPKIIWQDDVPQVNSKAPTSIRENKSNSTQAHIPGKGIMFLAYPTSLPPPLTD
jgi:hypothetical protein